ncbi:uncharacterized protein LOC110979538 [Acanthaster planci]|uniref:Uncharacterized protein LOC110979538 n=1 Tax=Acanthaster planci TaxID=133434 RepID=A0A8B7YCY0_ACAPL|nr:uncharacterized protein LOC110979538 [Acanthaster planci]
MASASKLEMVNRTLRGVLLSEKGGVAINRVQGDYRDFTGTSLPFKEFGYASLEAFLRSIPNVVSLHRGPDGVVLCKCVTDDSTQRIGSLVNRQKGKKKGKGSGITAKPGRPNARLAKPVYQSNPSHKPRPIRPKFQASKQAPQQVRFLKQQNYARPGQQSINWVSSGPPKQTPPTKQLSTKPTNSSFSANSSKPKQHSASIVYQSAASSNEAALTTQQPAPRPWSGKLGAKRNKQLASSTLADNLQGQPDEAANQTGQSATYENIYITVENDSFQKDRSGNRPKTKFAKGKKQEWSANFDVPPRFKKLMSPTTGVQDHYDNQDGEPNKTSAPVVHTSPSGNFSGDVQIDRTTSDWIQKVLKEKPNGIWASALCDMHKKVFDQTLDPGVIGTMAQHNLIQRESIMGSVILYPKLTVCLGDSSVSKTTQRSVTLGPRDYPEVGGAAEKENQTGNGSLWSYPKAEPYEIPLLAELTHPTAFPNRQDSSPADLSMTSILQAVCQRQNVQLNYKTDYVILHGNSYHVVRCTAGPQVGIAYGVTEKAAMEGASANVLYRWNIMPGELPQAVTGCEELYLRVEHQAGLCNCTLVERDDGCKVPKCVASWLKRRSWKPSDDWVDQQNQRLVPTVSVARRTAHLTQDERLEARAARFCLKTTPEEEESSKAAPLMSLSFSPRRVERFCVFNSKTLQQLQDGKHSSQVPKNDCIPSKLSSTREVSVDLEAAWKTDQSFPDVQEHRTGLNSSSVATQDEILKLRAERIGLTLHGYTHSRGDMQSTPTATTGETDDNLKLARGIQSDMATAPSQRALDLEIRQVLRETFGRTAIYETVKDLGSGKHPLVSVCFIAGSVIGVGKGRSKLEARKAALKELLMNQRQLKMKLETKRLKKVDQEEMPNLPAQTPESVSRIGKDDVSASQPKNLTQIGGQNDTNLPCGQGFTRWQQKVAPAPGCPRRSSDSLSPRTASPGVSLPGGNPSAPDDQLPRNTPPQDSDAAGITHSLVGVRLAETQSLASASTEETSSEPRGGLVLSNLEVPGVPSLQLPEENEWDVYVAYITSLSDFWVILIGDEYSEQLIILEEEMRTFYQCCTWTLTEPPEAGDCYAAEFNREWLRVEVKSVEGDKVQCFLLDHGDLETADITSLRPLSETFLQLPFQVVRCKLTGCEQVANDDQTALQMFCQLALGKSLLAEITSRDGDCIVMELFDDSDVSVLEQCMTAGI